MPSRSLPSTGTDPESGRLRLFHGTDSNSANWIIAHGLDKQRAIATGGTGDFWCTADFLTANVFAAVNPTGGMPIVIGFALPTDVVRRCLERSWAYLHEMGIYEFKHQSFGAINDVLTNIIKIDVTISLEE